MLRRGEGFWRYGFWGFGAWGFIQNYRGTTILTRLFGCWESMAVQDLRFGFPEDSFRASFKMRN